MRCIAVPWRPSQNELASVWQTQYLRAATHHVNPASDFILQMIIANWLALFILTAPILLEYSPF